MRTAYFAATLALAAALTLAPVAARAEEESLAYSGIVGVGSVGVSRSSLSFFWSCSIIRQ